LKNKPRFAALVPMRHSSERVPGKNYRCFAGRPLYHHVIETLRSSGCFETIVIDTDSLFIKTDAEEFFPDVVVLDRPQHLRDGSIPMNDVLLHTTGRIDADYYLQTHSTNPLLTAATVNRAVSTFLDHQNTNDSLFSVKRLQTRLWDASGRPLNHDPDKLIRTQDLPPVFEENSCIYLFSRQTLQKRGNRIGAHPLLFEMDTFESWDIDEESDFRLAELLYLNRNNLGGTLT